MSSNDDNEELRKAKFYYEAVLKLEELSQKSYERVNTKINIFIGVLSTVIPILTGIGYVVLSNTFAISFFVFYVISLGILVGALAKCVYLLGPKWFKGIKINYFMKKYRRNPSDYIIAKVASKWESIIQKNLNRISLFSSGLQQIVRLIIVGLASLIFAFVQLGLEFYLMPSLIVAPFNTISANHWRLILLGICLEIFTIMLFYIWKYTEDKDKITADHSQNKPNQNKEKPTEITQEAKKEDKTESELVKNSLLLTGASLLGALTAKWLDPLFSFSDWVSAMIYWMFIVFLVFIYALAFNLLPRVVVKVEDGLTRRKKKKSKLK